MAFKEIKDLFKSEEQRLEEAEIKKQLALDQVEISVGEMNKEIMNLKKERDNFWSEAARYLEEGNKAASDLRLRSARKREIDMAKLGSKAWYYGEVVSDIKATNRDGKITAEIERLNLAIHIDPVCVQKTVNQIKAMKGKQATIDRIIASGYEDMIGSGEGNMAEAVPSFAEMEKQLQAEVANRVRRNPPVQPPERESVGDDIKQQIGEGLKRLKDLMEDQK